MVTSLSSDVCSLVREQTADWDVDDIYVVNSGKFTVERLLKDQGVNLHGNDITMLSCALGTYQANADFSVALKPMWEQEYGWLKPYIVHPSSRVATLMLAAKAFASPNNQNTAYRRRREMYRKHWESLHLDTTENVTKRAVTLASFTALDPVEFMLTVPHEAGVIVTPPTPEISVITDMFAWDRPPSEMLELGRLWELLDEMVKHDSWVLVWPEQVDDLDYALRGHVQSRSTPMYVYASDPPRRVAHTKEKIEHVLVPRLNLGEAIGDVLTVAPLTIPQFNSLRLQYGRDQRVPVQRPFGVTVDGHLVGAFGYSLRGKFTDWAMFVPNPHASLVSHFSVPSDYANLDRLILRAALANETKALLERYSNGRWRSVVTTALSDNPKVDKYEDLFVLLRKDAPKPGINKRHELKYAAAFPDKTLQTMLDEWRNE